MSVHGSLRLVSCEVHRLRSGAWAEAPASWVGTHAIAIWYRYVDGVGHVRSVWLWTRNGPRPITNRLNRPSLCYLLLGIQQIANADAFRLKMLMDPSFLPPRPSADPPAVKSAVVPSTEGGGSFPAPRPLLGGRKLVACERCRKMVQAIEEPEKEGLRFEYIICSKCCLEEERANNHGPVAVED